MLNACRGAGGCLLSYFEHISAFQTTGSKTVLKFKYVDTLTKFTKKRPVDGSIRSLYSPKSLTTRLMKAEY